jgi:RNA-directed DNA polymerase
MLQEIKCWRLHLRNETALDALAEMSNPVLRGWINYYGAFYKSALHPVCRQFKLQRSSGGP